MNFRCCLLGGEAKERMLHLIKLLVLIEGVALLFVPIGQASRIVLEIILSQSGFSRRLFSLGTKETSFPFQGCVHTFVANGNVVMGGNAWD